MCYITLRGLVYFGSSIHVYHGAEMVLSLYYSLFSTSAPSIPTPSEVDVGFCLLFLLLGLLLFKGVEEASKGWIKWPTIAFTTLLAIRFLIEIVKQVQREREGILHPRLQKNQQHQHQQGNSNKQQDGGKGQGQGGQGGHTNSPYSYSSMSIDVDPLISAAVGIYIFILFVYNHTLEYDHREEMLLQRQPSEASSDTALLLSQSQGMQNHGQHQGHNAHNGQAGGGDTNNNASRVRTNPLFDLENDLSRLGQSLNLNERPISLNLNLSFQRIRERANMNMNGEYLVDEQALSLSPTPPEYKVDAV